ncbi:MAG: TIGR02453 family protein [Rhodobacter sp.]|nr:TIGR02453 family protein [Rhodobacter sp.]
MTQRFNGFPTDGQQFLVDLAREQNRDWFAAHRSLYDDALQGPLIDLVLDLTDELARRGVPLQGDPKRNIFRIHRDVRFSKDKSPYKTHVSATLTADGGKLSFGILYIQIDPKGAFVACGFYMPEPADLAAMREALVADPAAWRRIESALALHGLALEPDEAALKRVPRGFEGVDDAALHEMLKRRSWIISVPLTKAEIGAPGLVNKIADFATAAMPLLRFGLSATGRA